MHKNIPDFVRDYLAEHAIDYDYYEHELIFTVEEWEHVKQTVPGTHTKNLFLTNKKGTFFLVSVESSKRLAINAFRKMVGTSEMSFASPEDMMRVLWLTPWSVTLLGLIHAMKSWYLNPPSRKLSGSPHQGGSKLRVFLDKDLREAEQIGCHPCRNDATLMLSHAMVEKFLQSVRCEVGIIEL